MHWRRTTSVWVGFGGSISRYVLGGGITSTAAWATTDMVGGIGDYTWVSNGEGSRIERDSTSGEVTTYPLSGGAGPFSGTPAGPLGIALGSEGSLWIAEQNIGRIGRLTASGDLQEFPIPLPPGLPPPRWWRAEPRYLAEGSEGDMWFTDPGTESVGRVTPTGEITEYRIPPAPSNASAIAGAALVPNEITAVPGGLLFSESGVKALGFIEPSASAPPERPLTAVTAHHRKGAVGGRCGDMSVRVHLGHPNAKEKTVCRSRGKRPSRRRIGRALSRRTVTY